MELTQKIKDWLESQEQDINTGAELLLRVNRNRILHQNIIRRNMKDKLIYELEKVLSLREHGDPCAQVPQMEEKAKELTIPQEGEEHERGMRPDHDSLPDEIKLLVEKNLLIYPIMRKLQESLKLLKTPCDREPYLKELLALDASLRANWNQYDTFDKNNASDPSAIDAKRISANRKYLSQGKKTILNLEGERKADALAKMQIRYDELKAAKVGFDEVQLAELIAIGIKA